MFGGTRRFRYMACTDCGAEYQDPMPSAREIGAFYPPAYAVHQPLSGRRNSRTLKRAVLKYRYGYSHLPVPKGLALLAPLFSRIGLPGAVPYIENGELLDVGCGNGKFLLEMTGLGWKGTGIEVSDAALAVCRKAGLEVLHGDLHDAAFEEGRFDVVTARHVIEHLPEPGAFVAEVARILKPGGRFIIETPNSRALARPWFGANWYANDVPRHLVLYHPVNLKRLVESCGLRLVGSHTAATPKNLLSSWDHATGNKGRPSRKRKVRRLLARPYVVMTRVLGRGDAVHQMYERRV